MVDDDMLLFIDIVVVVVVFIRFDEIGEWWFVLYLSWLCDVGCSKQDNRSRFTDESGSIYRILLRGVLKGFDVICQQEDPKTKKVKQVEGRLVERNNEFTIINVKGRVKKMKNSTVLSVKLPKAKKEKGKWFPFRPCKLCMEKHLITRVNANIARHSNQTTGYLLIEILQILMFYIKGLRMMSSFTVPR